MAGCGAIPVQLSPDFVAALRHAYVETDKPVREICAEFEISTGKIDRLIKEHGWPQRMDRPPRALPPALKLREEARRLAAGAPLSASPPPKRGRSDREAIRVGVASNSAMTPTTPTLPLSGGGSPDGESADSESDPAARIEQLVLRELAAEEAVRAQLGAAPRARAEAERSARTLSILTQTLQNLQRLRAGQMTAAQHQSGSPDDDEFDDMPADLDEFRRELARRIDAFIASRTDGGDAGGDPDAAVVA